MLWVPVEHAMDRFAAAGGNEIGSGNPVVFQENVREKMQRIHKRIVFHDWKCFEGRGDS
jgi:hypothetical protein